MNPYFLEGFTKVAISAGKITKAIENRIKSVHPDKELSEDFSVARMRKIDPAHDIPQKQHNQPIERFQARSDIASAQKNYPKGKMQSGFGHEIRKLLPEKQ